MLEVFYPDELQDSAFDLDYEAYAKAGYKAILFDIDNTLVPHGAPADDRSVALFARLRELSFKTCLVSNNKEPRVKPFADRVGSAYLCKAGKPFKRGYEEAMRLLGSDADTTLVIGDQIFTDIWGARLLGIHTILTRPIHPKEEIQIVLKRYLEKIVLWFYHKRKRNG